MNNHPALRQAGPVAASVSEQVRSASNEWTVASSSCPVIPAATTGETRTRKGRVAASVSEQVRSASNEWTVALSSCPVTLAATDGETRTRGGRKKKSTILS
jgi:hypothetical protein